MVDESFVNKDVEIMDASEAMSIVQLPIIEERFGILKQQIQNIIDEALSLECTEETVRDVKKARAALNKQFQQNYESARKEIKTKVLAPYNLFENLYNENISSLFQNADKQLGDRIKQVEGELKDKKREEAARYFSEYKAAIGLSEEPFEWEDVGVAVNLSSSIKSLKESAKLFLDNVKTDLSCIRSHPYSDEVMVEYHNCHNLATAIYTVEVRHEAIEREKERAEAVRKEREEQEAHESEVREAVEEEKSLFHAPDIEDKPDQPEEDPVEYEVTFRVKGTLEEIVHLKNYLEDNDLDWEQVAAE